MVGFAVTTGCAAFFEVVSGVGAGASGVESGVDSGVETAGAEATGDFELATGAGAGAGAASAPH